MNHHPATPRWPDGKKCAFVLTVGFEAELAILAVAPDAVDRAKSLSVGQYGATRGVDRLLKELARTGTRASWFIPASNLDRYPRQCEAVADAGHELGNMGWALEDFGSLAAAEQLEIVGKSQDAFESRLGQKPVGFRAGRGSYAPGLTAGLVQGGFTWSSSWHGDDLPHFHAGGARSLVEISRHHELDDFPYFVFNLDPPIPKGSPRIASSREVLRNWIHEFDAYRAESLCFVLTVHPELIATPGRIALLREFMDHATAHDDVWLATGGEVAQWWRQRGEANPPGHPAEVFEAITLQRRKEAAPESKRRKPVTTAQRTASQEFSSYITSLALADVPPAAQHRAKLHILDTLGAGIAGSASAEAAICRTALGEAHGSAAHGSAANGGGAPVWGTPDRVPPLQAAFINGVASHAFELDDSGGCDHSGAVVLPAALAAAAMAPGAVSGERLMLAVIAGYELGRRVQTALGGYDAVNNAGWHSTGVCGTFAAAAAAGIVLDLDAAQLTSAIGLAGSFTGGTWAFMGDGSMSKRLHVGRAAEAGLNSVVLARAGFTGPADIFAAPWGSFLKLYGGAGADEKEVCARLGEQWLVERASIKPYASCRSTHSAIDALLFLKQEHSLVPGDIEKITVLTSSLIYDMCGGYDVSSLVSAQLSMPFALATAMLGNGVGLKDISTAGRTDASVTAMMDRVRIEVDSTQSGGSAEPVLVLQTRKGVYRHQAVVARGAAANRLSDGESVQKFVGLAGTRLAAADVERIADQILALEDCDDVAALQLLMGTGDEPALIR